MKFLSSKNLSVIIISIVLISTNVFAQYYSGTDGLNGTLLKSTLHSKISNHVRFPYSDGSTDTWDILKETDKDPNNSANVILIYTDESVNAAQEFNNNNGWNREHVWASSHGFPDRTDTAYTDVHHLRPSNINANSTRGNKDFDYGGSSTYEKDVHYDSDSWEPRDEIKGDVARMMLYMTVRYEGADGYDLEFVDYTPSSGSNFGKLSSLLEWNRLDPVSAFERNRNRVIYKYQKNFNPFVDHPEFADRIYNSDKLIIEKAEQVNGNEVVLTFSKELNSTEAERSNNYNLDMFGNPLIATSMFSGDAKKVLLTFDESFADTFYNVRVSNLQSTTGETIIPNSIALFLADEIVEADTVAPAKPTNFTAIHNDDVINLNWTANSETDISHYAIYRGVIQNFTPSIYSLLTTVTTNSFDDSEIFDYRVYYKISAFDKSGNESDYSDEASILVGVNNEGTKPSQFSLSQNYPNPFNPSTIIRYSIGVERSRGISEQMVTLKIYNILGKEIVTLVNETKSSGNYEVSFNTQSQTGNKLSSGLYFYTLSVGNFRETKSMLLIK